MGFDEKLSSYLLSLEDAEARHQFALESLELFVGANFTGCTDIAEAKLQGLKMAVESDSSDLDSHAFEQLSFGLNSPGRVVRKIALLWAAVHAVEEMGADAHVSFSHALLGFRTYRIWSIILEEKSVELKAKLDECISTLDGLCENQGSIPAPATSLLVQYHLERASLKFDYYEAAEAKHAIESAAALAGIELDLSGAQGRRTRFQTRSVPQLVLKVKARSNTAQPAENNAQSSTTSTTLRLPPVCSMSDDTLLDEVKFDTDDSGLEYPQQLSDDQLAVMLASAVSATRGRSFDELEREEALVRLNEVIRRSRNWAILFRALVERCFLERHSKRRVERACSQIEVLANLLDGIDSTPGEDGTSKHQRLEHIYCSAPLPFWRVKKLQGEILASLGCTSEALLVFESLKAWSDVIGCYKALNQLEKGEALVRKLLSEDPWQPMLHCYLGDVSGDTAHYHKAIELSTGRCAYAHAVLGRFAMKRGDYTEAMEHFRCSLRSQPLQTNLWFNLGHCAMKHGEHREAAKAYQRLVSYEPDHFEAWNNLAACYMNLDERPRAQKILKEALRLSAENEKLWENLLLISLSIGDWQESMNAVGSLLDLEKRSKIDELPLRILLTEVLGKDDKSLHTKMLQLLARISSRQSLGSKVARLHAELKRPSSVEDDLAGWSAYTQLLEVAIRREEEESPTKGVDGYIMRLTNSIQLIEALKTLWQLQRFTPQQIASQTKLRVRPLLAEVEEEFGKDCYQTENSELKTLYQQVQSFVSRSL